MYSNKETIIRSPQIYTVTDFEMVNLYFCFLNHIAWVDIFRQYGDRRSLQHGKIPTSCSPHVIYTVQIWGDLPIIILPTLEDVKNRWDVLKHRALEPLSTSSGVAKSDHFTEVGPSVIESYYCLRAMKTCLIVVQNNDCMTAMQIWLIVWGRWKLGMLTVMAVNSMI